MTPEVEQAVAEVGASFDGHRVETEDDGEGGAIVTVHDLDLGPAYAPQFSWCAFHITFQYPHADVYPHHLVPELARANGQPLGEAFSGPTEWRGRRVIQVSRKANHLDPAVDTAVAKLHKVLAWARSS